MPLLTATRTPMAGGYWRFAPRTVLLTSAVIAIFLCGVAAYVALKLPWLGVDFVASPGQPGLSVVDVAKASPNHGRIKQGQVIVAFGDAAGRTVALHDHLLLDEPDVLPYARLQQFIDDQTTLASMVDYSPLAITATGERIPLTTRAPPLTILWGSFALQIGYALISLFIALGIWVVRPEQIAARFFALSGFGVLINGLPLSIYSCRELLIDGRLFEWLSALNHVGTLVICASLVSLFWVYPRRLDGDSLRVPALFFLAAVGCWLLDFFKISSGASTTIYLFIFLSYIAGLSFAALQWGASQGNPTDRAALKWCLLAIFSGTVMLIGLVTIPPVFGAYPLVPVSVGYAGFLTVYLGLAAGLLRYRLFDVERWWFKTWLWFAAGLLVVMLDLLLISFINMANSKALALSLALSGWLYFPLRQLLWEKLGRRFSISRDGALRELVDTLFSAKFERQIIATWPYLLNDTFKPLVLTHCDSDVETLTISADGARMLVPALEPENQPLVLEFPEQGGRLFAPQDLRTLNLLYDLTRKALQGLRAREVGAETERNRIMRDLHDDLGARLLDLVYVSESPACRDIALAAIEDLRGLVGAASGDPAKLGGLMMTCEGEARARLDEAGITLQWQLADDLPGNMMVSARAVSNIMRTLREAMTNVIRHAQADNVKVVWRAEQNWLVINITDNGRGGNPADWVAGHGTRTIHTRTGDLGGQVRWKQAAPNGCRLEVRLPLPL